MKTNDINEIGTYLEEQKNIDEMQKILKERHKLKANEEQKRIRMLGYCGEIFGMIVLIAIALFILKPFINIYIIKKADIVKTTVINSEPVQYMEFNSKCFYEFNVNGTQYAGNDVVFVGSINKNIQGSEISVWYYKDKPESNSIYFTLYTCGAMMLLFYSIIRMIKAIKKIHCKIIIEE